MKMFVCTELIFCTVPFVNYCLNFTQCPQSLKGCYLKHSVESHLKELVIHRGILNIVFSFSGMSEQFIEEVSRPVMFSHRCHVKDLKG